MRAEVVDITRDRRIRKERSSQALGWASSILLVPIATSAAPSPELAKLCLRAAYMLYPYERPGTAPMNGGRLFFFRNCMANHKSPPPPSESAPARLQDEGHFAPEQAACLAACN
jgi:hypothetical protein